MTTPKTITESTHQQKRNALPLISILPVTEAPFSDEKLRVASERFPLHCVFSNGS
jgi:hypothetical protein